MNETLCVSFTRMVSSKDDYLSPAYYSSMPGTSKLIDVFFHVQLQPACRSQPITTFFFFLTLLEKNMKRMLPVMASKMMP